MRTFYHLSSVFAIHLKFLVFPIYHCKKNKVKTPMKLLVKLQTHYGVIVVALCSKLYALSSTP